MLRSLEVERVFLRHFPQLLSARLIFVGACRFLFLNFAVGTSATPRFDVLTLAEKAGIPRRLWPTRVFCDVDLAHFLTENGWKVYKSRTFFCIFTGKIDESRMAEFARRTFNRQLFTSANSVQFLHEHFGLKLIFENETDEENLLNGSLKVVGLGSLEIAEIALRLETALLTDRFANDEERRRIIRSAYDGNWSKLSPGNFDRNVY